MRLIVGDSVCKVCEMQLSGGFLQEIKGYSEDSKQ